MLSTPRRRLAAWFVIGVLVASLVLLTLVAIVQTRGTTAAIRASQQQRADTFALLVDCTSPSGRCFQRGQRQTANAVASINKVTVYAASCASQRPGQSAEEIRRCVVRLLARDAERRGHH
jgi:hypothetical protein